MPGTRKLGRTTDHRMSMLRGQVTYLLEKGRIETTVTRAKEVKALPTRWSRWERPAPLRRSARR